MRYKRVKAFTLLEVLIVLAIIGIIVSIAAYTWFRQREISRGRACQENLTKISDAKERVERTDEQLMQVMDRLQQTRRRILEQMNQV